MELVHWNKEKDLVIFYFNKKYYKCNKKTWCNLILKEMKIEETEK